MNLETCLQDDQLLKFFDIDKSCLPEIKSCCEYYGNLNLSSFKNTPIFSVIGDQQAATLGQGCTKVGDVKCT